MSFDWLEDLEREVDNGKEYYACPAIGRNQWTIADTVDELLRIAKRSANQKKIPVNIVQIVSRHDAVTGDLFLVPTKIGEQNHRGGVYIEWSVVETKEASEMMRDLRYGQAPYFAMQTVEEVHPDDTGDSKK